MANIQLKRSAVQGRVPTTTDLELGELGLNTYDGKIYMKKNDGTESVIEVGGSATLTVDSTAPSNPTEGELWYDTQSLQLFVWNNNAWVTAMSPLSSDVVITEALADIQSLKAKPEITSSTTAPANPKQGDLWFNPSTLKFAFFTAGAWINPDQS